MRRDERKELEVGEALLQVGAIRLSSLCERASPVPNTVPRTAQSPCGHVDHGEHRPNTFTLKK